MSLVCWSDRGDHRRERALLNILQESNRKLNLWFGRYKFSREMESSIVCSVHNERQVELKRGIYTQNEIKFYFFDQRLWSWDYLSLTTRIRINFADFDRKKHCTRIAENFFLIEDWGPTNNIEDL